MNLVVIAVALMLVLSLLRINGGLLAIGAIAGGLPAASPREDPQHLHRRPGWRRRDRPLLRHAGALRWPSPAQGITDLLARRSSASSASDASRSRILWVKSLLITSPARGLHLLPEPDPGAHRLHSHPDPAASARHGPDADRSSPGGLRHHLRPHRHLHAAGGFGGIFLNNILAKNLSTTACRWNTARCRWPWPSRCSACSSACSSPSSSATASRASTI